METALHLAIKNNYYDIANVLIEKGAFIDVKDNKGNTPLLLAAMTGNIECLQLCLNKGANIENCDNLGAKAIHIAANYCQCNTLDILLSIGADIKSVDYNNKTALDYVACYDNDDDWKTLEARIDCIVLLLKKGATIDNENTEENYKMLINLAQSRI